MRLSKKLSENKKLEKKLSRALSGDNQTIGEMVLYASWKLCVCLKAFFCLILAMDIYAEAENPKIKMTQSLLLSGKW